jgi:outer membrane protein
VLTSARALALLVAVLLPTSPPAARPAGAAPPVRSVDECVAIALRQHPALKAAEAQLLEARFHPAQAAAAGLPKVTAQYTGLRQKTTLGALVEAPNKGVLGFEDTFGYNRGDFSVTQVLWDFGKTLKLWQAAQAEVASRVADREAAERAVVQNVKRAYFGLIAADRLHAVAAQASSTADLLLRVSSDRFNAGLAPRFDVLRQQSNLANAQLAELTARNTLLLARETLRDAMGLEQPIDFVPDDRTLDFSRVVVNEADALARAAVARAEIVSALAMRKAAEERVAALVRDYLPVAIGQADYNFSGENAETEGWRIGVIARLNVFDGGLTAAKIGAARAELLQAEAEIKRVQQQVTLDVRQSVVNAERAAEAIGVSEKSVVAAREAARVSGTRYQTGIGNVIELTTTEAASFAAQAEHVRLLAEYRVALADLERATGVPVPAH